MIELFVILLMGLVPPIVSLLAVRVAEERIRARLDSVSHQSHVPRTSRTFLASDTGRQFVNGVGYCTGDTSCRFNARSAYLRCAVNPSGPCEGCIHYESIEMQQPSIAQS